MLTVSCLFCLCVGKGFEISFRDSVIIVAFLRARSACVSIIISRITPVD